MSEELYRRNIPILLTSIVILIMTLVYYLDFPFLEGIVSVLTNSGIILSSFAFFFGAATMIVYHGNHITKRTPEKWWYGSIVVATMIIFIIVGVVFSSSSEQYQWIFQTIYTPMSMAITGLPVFWLASAAYRTFKLRSIESFILIISAFISLLALAPIGGQISPLIPNLADWIIKIPTTGASRGIVIGAGIGLFSLSLRILLGREKVHIGEIE